MYGERNKRGTASYRPAGRSPAPSVLNPLELAAFALLFGLFSPLPLLAAPTPEVSLAPEASNSWWSEVQDSLQQAECHINKANGPGEPLAASIVFIGQRPILPSLPVLGWI